MAELSPRLRAFYQKHPEMSPQAPVDEVYEGAKRYKKARAVDMPNYSRADFRQVEVSPYGPRIGAAYHALPSYDKAAEPDFEAFRVENGRQFDFLTKPRSRGGIGVDVSVQDSDPYVSAGRYSEMMDDIRGGKLKIWASKHTGGHPLLTDDENDMFRAVHDVFGHAGTGRGFDRHGEEAAWISHSSMYHPAAQRAMGIETRGQNSALNYGPTPGEFAEQKVARLPTAYTDPTRTSLIGRRNAAFRGVVR